MVVLMRFRCSAVAVVATWVVLLVVAFWSAEEARASGEERIGDNCGKDDIVITQAQSMALPSGIPTYTVEVHNLCSGGCSAMSDIHFSCGSFSSARLVNPRVFRRLRDDDCLLNDGRPLRSGGSVSFQYANTFKYPLAVASATCSAR